MANEGWNLRASEHEGKGQEVENQSELRQLREFAALRGWTVYREYIDHAEVLGGLSIGNNILD